MVAVRVTDTTSPRIASLDFNLGSEEAVAETLNQLLPSSGVEDTSNATNGTLTIDSNRSLGGLPVMPAISQLKVPRARPLPPGLHAERVRVRAQPA